MADTRTLMHVPSGRVYLYTDLLARRSDMRLQAAAQTADDTGDEDSNDEDTSEDSGEVNASERETGTQEVAASVKPVSRMSKDEVLAHVRDRYGVDLDATQTLQELRREAQRLRQGYE